ncbi:hypothetical protein [Microbacterium oxydans]|uniref:hypothetical protein n=1 Tax=Microbacterium oxydans TaxID=82380 RepID=UPI00366D7D12
MSNLYDGSTKSDPTHGELTLRHRTRLSFGEAAWYWETGDGEEVRITPEEQKQLEPPRSRPLSGD